MYLVSEALRLLVKGSEGSLGGADGHLTVTKVRWTARQSLFRLGRSHSQSLLVSARWLAGSVSSWQSERGSERPIWSTLGEVARNCGGRHDCGCGRVWLARVDHSCIVFRHRWHHEGQRTGAFSGQRSAT